MDAMSYSEADRWLGERWKRWMESGEAAPAAPTALQSEL